MYVTPPCLSNIEIIHILGVDIAFLEAIDKDRFL